MILNLYILYCKSDVMSRPGKVMEINKPWRTLFLWLWNLIIILILPLLVSVNKEFEY